MRTSASIAHWLPYLGKYLENLVLLEDGASELFRLSLLGKKLISSRLTEPIWGYQDIHYPFKPFHEHLLKQGLKKARNQNVYGLKADCVYYREDLGKILFIISRGVKNGVSDSNVVKGGAKYKVSFLMENTHSVEVKYLNHHFDVKVPQVGRFILEKGLRLKRNRIIKPALIFWLARDLTNIMELMINHRELQNEALMDMSEIRPSSLIKQFLTNLKSNGPGSVVWESAQKLFLENHPNEKIVLVTSWYWKFLTQVSQLLREKTNE